MKLSEKEQKALRVFALPRGKRSFMGIHALSIRALERKGLLKSTPTAGRVLTVKGRAELKACVNIFDDLFEERARAKRSRSTRRDRVRSSVRGRPDAPTRRQEAQLKQLNVDAATAIGFDRAAAEVLPPPSVALHFGLVGHGYEIHFFDEGKYVGATARDFSGNHKIVDVKESLVDAIEKAVKEWRAKL